MKKISTTTKFKGYNRLDELELETKSGERISRELLINKDGVAALIYDTKKSKFVFVKQWRPCINQEMVEVVAGSIEEGETAEEAIEKEIFEETGYEVDKLMFLEKFYVSPGTITESVSLFYVTVSKQIKTDIGNDDENEELELVYMTLYDVMVYPFIDAKTLIAIQNC